MSARIIRDPASLTEKVSIRFFYESLQIAFPNNHTCQHLGTKIREPLGGGTQVHT